MPIDTNELRYRIILSSDVRDAVIAALVAAEALVAVIENVGPTGAVPNPDGPIMSAARAALAALPQSPPPLRCICSHLTVNHTSSRASVSERGTHCVITWCNCEKFTEPVATTAAGAGQ